VRVQDEFKHIESYLTIQKIRYRDILDYSIEYEHEMEQKVVLKLLLQPLVENALYHGIKNKRGKGTIVVRGWREKGFLCFSVTDNGVGMTGEQLASVKSQLAKAQLAKVQLEVDPLHVTGETENRIYGLYNVAKRLELYYNRTDLLDVQSVYMQGTLVTLLVPEFVLDEAGLAHSSAMPAALPAAASPVTSSMGEKSV
jgi:two-component system sensor histidine kinase YesM